MTASKESEDGAYRHLPVVLVLGPPGAGKGTMCTGIKEGRKCFHLSVGDYLRELRDDNANMEHDLSMSDSAQEVLRKRLSLLTPAEARVVTKLINVRLASEDCKQYEFVLLDGFPRNIASAVEFRKFFGDPGLVLVLQCDEHEAQQRFLGRGRETTDTIQVFQKRFSDYRNNMQAIVPFFQSRSTVVVVNVDDTIEANIKVVLAAIDEVYSYAA